jgi:hypothetical protein
MIEQTVKVRLRRVLPITHDPYDGAQDVRVTLWHTRDLRRQVRHCQL